MSELEKMYEVILDRKENPEEGRYTNYLFDKGLEKILKKVGEESTETVIAALSQSNEDLINELNDLAYHLLVLMAAKGITPADFDRVAKEREAKQHNLKPERRKIEKY